jgi:hypothetical protein
MHALAGLANLSLQSQLLFKPEPAAGAFVEVRFESGSRFPIEFVIDERGNKLLCFLAVHLFT